MTHRTVSHQFELQVVPHGGHGYGLELYQRRVGKSGENGAELGRVVRVWGDPLKAVIDQVLAAIKHAGYRPTDLSRTRQAPFTLREEDGVRLGVLFLAVKPLRKLARIEAIADRLRAMQPEELFYWYSKSTAAQGASHAQRALRILVAGE